MSSQHRHDSLAGLAQCAKMSAQIDFGCLSRIIPPISSVRSPGNRVPRGKDGGQYAYKGQEGNLNVTTPAVEWIRHTLPVP